MSCLTCCLVPSLVFLLEPKWWLEYYCGVQKNTHILPILDRRKLTYFRTPLLGQGTMLRQEGYCHYTNQHFTQSTNSRIWLFPVWLYAFFVPPLAYINSHYINRHNLHQYANAHYINTQICQFPLKLH
jgi:hypothetical protein